MSPVLSFDKGAIVGLLLDCANNLEAGLLPSESLGETVDRAGSLQRECSN